MPFRLAVLWIVLAAAALAQTTPETRTFTFAHAQTAGQMQGIASIIRSAVEARDVSVDAARSALTVSGNADQLASTAWLFTELDKPAGPAPQNLVVRESTFADPRSPAVKIFYPAHVGNPQQLQEIVNMIRSIADVQRVMILGAPIAIVTRGSAEQETLAESLVREIDQPSTAAPRGVREYVYPDTAMFQPELRTTAVRVYYPSQIQTPLDLQEAINGLRSIAEIQRAVAITWSRAIVTRGNTDQAVLTDWLIKEFDQLAPAGHEYRWGAHPDGIVRSVFLAKDTDLKAVFQRVREVSGLPRVVFFTGRRGLVLRGTPDQIAKAQTVLP